MPKMQIKLLPKAQQTQGIEYFDSFNIFGSKQKLQQALKSWSNFSLVCLPKCEKYIRQLWQIHATSLTNPCSKIEKSMYQSWQIHVKVKEYYVTIVTNPKNWAKHNHFTSTVHLHSKSTGPPPPVCSHLPWCRQRRVQSAPNFQKLENLDSENHQIFSIVQYW